MQNYLEKSSTLERVDVRKYSTGIEDEDCVDSMYPDQLTHVNITATVCDDGHTRRLDNAAMLHSVCSYSIRAFV